MREITPAGGELCRLETHGALKSHAIVQLTGGQAGHRVPTQLHADACCSCLLLLPVPCEQGTPQASMTQMAACMLLVAIKLVRRNRGGTPPLGDVFGAAISKGHHVGQRQGS